MGVIIIQIRRPLLIILVFVIAISFIITNNTKNNEEINDKIITIQGIVKGKIEKKRYNQYKVGVFLINDYTKNKNLKIGQKVNITGKFKSLAEKMNIDREDIIAFGDNYNDIEMIKFAGLGVAMGNAEE
ncbi:HAD hydrolase family protein, partial [Clostridioides difficile]|uniref:HAD hydrolase family protein n=1 Tax=Clostridioides difficile TaxID=1496 RepID=UPI001889D1B6